MSDPSLPAQVRAPSRPPRSYLGWGLAATALCFLPLGIVVVVFAMRTREAIAQDRTEDAIRWSRVARAWLVATVAVGLLIDGFLAVVLIALGAFSS